MFVLVLFVRPSKATLCDHAPDVCVCMCMYTYMHIRDAPIKIFAANTEYRFLVKSSTDTDSDA